MEIEVSGKIWRIFELETSLDVGLHDFKACDGTVHFEYDGDRYTQFGQRSSIVVCDKSCQQTTMIENDYWKGVYDSYSGEISGILSE